MAEKVTSIRLEEKDLEQFREFAKKQGLNQTQAFNSLIALAELDRAKNTLGDRAKEIDAFRDTVNKLLNFYVNSLDINRATEETIREELKKELATKDNTIASLQEQASKLQEDIKKYKDLAINVANNNKDLNQQLQDLSNTITDKNKSIDKLNSNNDLLQEQLQEYKKYKEDYNNLQTTYQEQLTALQEDIKDRDKALNTLNNINKQLQDKFTNTTEILQIYKSNKEELRSVIAELKANITFLEKQNKEEIKELKEEHKEQLVKLEAIIEDKFENAIAVRNEQIRALTNKLEELEAKTKKKTMLSHWITNRTTKRE